MPNPVAAIWSGVPGRKCMVALRRTGSKESRVEKVDWSGEVDRFVAEHSDCDLFFAPGGFDACERKAAQSLGAGAFWLDIDCGPGKDYPDQTAALEALVAWIAKRDFPNPSLIISSGFGLHVYWLLTEPFARETWLAVARRLKAATSAEGLRADPTRTADLASILRIPGSFNHKKDPCLPCVVLVDNDARYDLYDIESKLPDMGPRSVPSRPIPNALPDDEDIAHEPGDAEAIIAGCEQIRSTWGQAGVPEPIWRAALSVLWRCEHGDSLIHEYSKGDPRYDPAQTAEKARGTPGPLSCTQFEGSRPEVCMRCPMRGHVVTPIQIRPVIKEPPKEAAPPWFSKVGNFHWSANGIVQIVDNNAPVPVTRTPIWISGFRQALRHEGERPYSEVELTYWQSNGQVKTNHIEASSLADQRKFDQELWNMGMTSVTKFPALRSALSAYTDEFVRSKGIDNGVKRLGWIDAGFCLGDRVVTPRGIATARIMGNAGPLKLFTPTGTLQGWKDAVAVLNQPRYMALAFAVCYGFGSVLLELANLQGATLVLQGESGAGKTTGAKAALAIWGPPSVLMQDAGQATERGLAVLLSLAHNCPVLIDEVTSLMRGRGMEKLGRIVLYCTNGTGGASLTRNRELRDMGNWALAPIMTTNPSIQDLGSDEFISAQRQRIAELPITQVMDRADGIILSGAEANAGQACLPYLEAICGMRAELRTTIAEYIRQLDRTHSFPAASRFISNTLGVTGVGGMIAAELGLIPFDVPALIDTAAKAFGSMVEDHIVEQDRPERWLPEFLRRNNDRCVIKVGKVVQGLQYAVRNPLANVINGELWISRSEVLDQCKKLAVSRHSFEKWLTAHGGNLVSWRLHTDVPKTPCYHLPAGVIDFDTNITS